MIRAMAKKRNDDPHNHKCGRNADGLRVLRIFKEETGELESEEVATVEVHFIGKQRSTGEVGLSAFYGGVGLGADHFNVFKKACQERSLHFDWNVRAWLARGALGREMARHLREEGFQVVEIAGRDNAQGLLGSVLVKFGAISLAQHSLVLVTGGFAVIQWDEYEYPCTLVDALILDDAGIDCGPEVKSRLARVRAVA